MSKVFIEISRLPKKLIDHLEGLEIPAVNFILTALFAIILRNFFESFTQRSGNYFDLSSSMLALTMLHFSLCYITVALFFILLFHFATKTKIENIIKVQSASMFVLVLAPLIDLIASGGQGNDMLYYEPNKNIDIFYNFLTYNSQFSGATLGIKIEFFIIMCASFLYFREKGKNVFFSLAYTLIGYAFTFLIGCLPVILNKCYELAGLDFEFSIRMAINFYSILILIMSMMIAYMWNKPLFSALVMDARPSRILHFEFMLLLGILIGLNGETIPVWQVLHSNPEVLSDSIFMAIGIFFAAIFAIIFNNVADYEIDQINCPNRPLVSGSVDAETYQYAGYLSLGISLYFSALVGFKSFFILLFVVGIYYLYSMPPLRLKRVLVFSKLTVSVSSLALVILGYLIVVNNLHDFPKLLYPIFLIGVTVSANIIDLKDYKGDKAAGVKTLPVVLGLKKAKFIIGLAFIFTYLSIYFVIRVNMLIPLLLVIGCAQYCFINAENFKEWKPMTIHLLCMLGLLMYFCWELSLLN